jgi:hypothetical protein
MVLGVFPLFSFYGIYILSKEGGEGKGDDEGGVVENQHLRTFAFLIRVYKKKRSLLEKIILTSLSP